MISLLPVPPYYYSSLLCTEYECPKTFNQDQVPPLPVQRAETKIINSNRLTEQLTTLGSNTLKSMLS